MSQSRSFLIPVFVLLCLVIMTALTYKAATSSITHDEAGTYLNHIVERQSVWACRTDPGCWRIANNHLLNTAMITVAVDLFGPDELAIRLPNLLALMLYLWGCGVILIRLSANYLELLLGFALLCLNPFCMDFFALARGYGIGLGCMMASIGSVWLFLRASHNWYWLAAGFVFASLAVFANLTYLSFLLVLAGSLLVYGTIKNLPRLSSLTHRKVMALLAVPLVCLGFIAWYFYHPIQFLSSRGEFLYGASSLIDSWFRFARDSVYGVTYFEGQHSVAAVLSAVLIVPSVVLGLRRYADQKTDAQLHFLVSLMCIMLFSFFILNNLVTGAQFPVGRKSIIYYPLTGLVVYLAICDLRQNRNVRWVRFVVLVVTTALVLHISRSYHPERYREWWYDTDTKRMIYEVAQMHSGEEQPLTLSTEWIFRPATQFYIKTKGLPVELTPFNRAITPDNGGKYYYLNGANSEPLGHDYTVIKTFANRILMRRND